MPILQKDTLSLGEAKSFTQGRGFLPWPSPRQLEFGFGRQLGVALRTGALELHC